MREVDVLGVRVEMPSNNPIVLLREVEGQRYLPIWIGAVEATAIAFAQQGVVPPRPLTHDLLKDVLEATGNELDEVRITEELLDQLEQYGLVVARRGTGHYDSDALVICTTARELADFGFEPRHLRAFKSAADREVGLVEQVVAPHKRGRDAAAKARAEEAVSEIAALSVRLHATLVKAGLRST
jgi:hypothetical protein